MSRVKQTSTKKRVMKSVPVLGAAGLTFSMIGGASAAAVPTADAAQSPTVGLGHQVTLGEEEIADVSLATFHLFVFPPIVSKICLSLGIFLKGVTCILVSALLSILFKFRLFDAI